MGFYKTSFMIMMVVLIIVLTIMVSHYIPAKVDVELSSTH